MRRFPLPALCAGFGLLFFSSQSWSRLMLLPSMADVQELAERAPLVFRGQVVAVTPLTPNPNPAARSAWLATIQVDRWYRGNGPTEVSLRFAYPDFASNGHDCIDFRAGGFWLVFAKDFAKELRAPLEMIDDCEGALTISSLRASNLQDPGWPQQMEADFLAGLDDHDPIARLASIQRLGGLKLPSSQSALHRIIESGDELESKWAVYAALRTGDVSVLPNVDRLLSRGERDLPESAIALELQKVDDRLAVPGLIEILKDAPGEMTRACVLTALGEKIKDRRAAPTLAAHLSDPDPGSRYNALNGLRVLTAEQACTLPEGWQESDIPPQISRCTLWWEQVGKFRDWN
jgi:hypothetical protein